jgi:predicted amino acid-binding ACT domain protein
VPHNIDIMHIDKNVFDNVFNTVMDVKGKTKDNIKARRDLEVYCHRLGLLAVGAGKEGFPYLKHAIC